MEREGIYVGNKEVTQRYIGTRLVWEKIKLLFNGRVIMFYERDNSRITLNKNLPKRTIKILEINGQKISFSSVEIESGQIHITFNDSVATFEQKTGINSWYNGSIPVKIYGYGGE